MLDGLAGQLDRTTLDGLALLVERAGETLRVVVTTRSDPPLPLARWRSRRAGSTTSARTSCASPTTRRWPSPRAADTSIRDADAVVALNHRVDGWPIGLHMALLARPADDARSAGDLVGGSDRLLANYLVVELLEAMTEDERDVALALSVLEWFDPDLCAELLGADAADAVRQLLGRGMFLSVVDPRVGSMRFHDLFRELMEMELGLPRPGPPASTSIAAPRWPWRARGDLMSAYRHLAVIGEAARAHELLVGPALQLVDQGDLDALHRFARQLPTPHHVTQRLAGRRPRRRRLLRRGHAGGAARGAIGPPRCSMTPRRTVGDERRRRPPWTPARPALRDRAARGRPRRGGGRHRRAPSDRGRADRTGRLRVALPDPRRRG